MAKDSSYFTGDRDFWDDGDFDSMKEQCVYAMIWQAHGTDIAGIRQRNDRLDSVRVHLTIEEFQDTLSILYTKGKIRVYSNKIWIKPGIWRNLGKGNYSKQQMEAVVTRLKHCNAEGLARDVVEYYKEKYGMEIPYTYPTDTLSLCTVPVTVSVSETVTELAQVLDYYNLRLRQIKEVSFRRDVLSADETMAFHECLNDKSVEDMKAAIDGCFGCSHNRQGKHLGFGTIFKPDKIGRYISLAATPEVDDSGKALDSDSRNLVDEVLGADPE